MAAFNHSDDWFLWVGVVWSLIVTSLALTACWVLSKLFKHKLTRSNFLGNRIPVIGGLAICFAGTGYGYMLNVLCVVCQQDHYSGFIFGSRLQTLAFLIACAGFGFLGLLDDLLGDRSAGGFRGHVLKLVRERKVTTGLVKAVGGGLIGLAAGYYLAGLLYESDSGLSQTSMLVSAISVIVTRPIGVLTVLGYGVFIALFANSMNLVDLRPGRCLSCTLALALVFGGIAYAEGQSIVLYLLSVVFCSALVVYPFDRSARLMLGDAGSNALGAVLGVCSICLMRRWEVAIGIVLLAAFQIWCEKHSLSQFIESKPLLRRLDRKIGVR